MIRLPYVLDNQSYTLADILNALMEARQGHSLDVASAYFNIGAYRLLQEGLKNLRSFRLLLGSEPGTARDIGLKHSLRRDLEQEAYSEETLRLVEDLIAYLRQPHVAVRLFERGFLHAKCYLFYGDKGGQLPLFERLLPMIGIVGSSNFTAPGLSTNKELNLAHKTLLEPEEVDDRQARAAAEHLVDEHASNRITDTNRRLLKSEVGARAILDLVEWYERQWVESRDFKDELVELLDASKFGEYPYTPFDIYLKAIYTYFKEELEGAEIAGTRSAVELSEFQEDAVKKARRILAKYDGVLIGDSVGMGKTWIGKKLLEDYAYHQRMKALVICPASLREMWQRELASATIAAQVLSQELLGQSNGRLDLNEYGDVDVILIDESHNFRNRNAQRYQNLETIISARQGRGRSGGRKKLILLTATPINNNIFDLYNQITLFTQNNRSYFAGAGIGDLYRYFHSARQALRDDQAGVALFNLLEEVVIRRTRPFIRQAYPNATIKGKPVHWPERRLYTVHYNLEETYEGLYEDIVTAIENLHLAQYNLEAYKRTGLERDEFEQGRGEALVGIFKTRYLKRLESSVDAFRISIRRALAFTKTFEEYLLGGKLLDSRSFQKALTFLTEEDEEDDATPASVAEDLEENLQAREFLEGLPEIDTSLYDLRALHHALQDDVDHLTDIWYRIQNIRPDQDDKLLTLKNLLACDLRGKKVLIFTYYKDTARYLYRQLGQENGQSWRASIGNPHIRRMDSGADPAERSRLVQAFSPRSNNKPDLAGTEAEVDILISTDVLSEGQNLQDCGFVLNYDLHWNPNRMVQRAGRIDRIGSEFDEIDIYNMFPEEGLERLLGLVESLSRKIAQIDATGFLDASVLGEVVHPRNFNTLRRIEEQDHRVVEEQEQFIELASSEFLLQQLRNLLLSGVKEKLESLPDGIHSGLMRSNHRGLFFYFTSPDPTGSENIQHYWRYYDLQTRQILDNRFTIANLISCNQDTPRVIGDADVFAIQEKIQDHILASITNQIATEAAPAILEPVQSTVAAILRSVLNSPRIERDRIRQGLKLLGQPMMGVTLKQLRRAYQEYQKDKDIEKLLTDVEKLAGATPATSSRVEKTMRTLTREDLHLVCWEYVWS